MRVLPNHTTIVNIVMRRKMTEEEIEEAALASALNMGAAKDLFHPNWGWVLLDGEVTEVGIEFFKWMRESKND